MQLWGQWRTAAGWTAGGNLYKWLGCSQKSCYDCSSSGLFRATVYVSIRMYCWETVIQQRMSQLSDFAEVYSHLKTRQSQKNHSRKDPRKWRAKQVLGKDPIPRVGLVISQEKPSLWITFPKQGSLTVGQDDSCPSGQHILHNSRALSWVQWQQQSVIIYTIGI